MNRYKKVEKLQKTFLKYLEENTESFICDFSHGVGILKTLADPEICLGAYLLENSNTRI